MPRKRRSESLFIDDERAVSIAVTHVLAIGITTILISGLLIGATGLLDQQRDEAAREELNTIGNRLATQIEKADSLVDGDGEPEKVTFVVEQPARVSGGSYTVDLVQDPSSNDACDDADRPLGGKPDKCLVLEPSSTDLDIRRVDVPLQFNNSGGVTVSLTNRGGGEFLIVVKDPP